MLPAPLRTFLLACRWSGIRLTRELLLVWVGSQRVDWLSRCPDSPPGTYEWKRRFVASTSRFGTGQVEGSNQTPLGLHRIARKVGGGWPIGTVFRGRIPVGLTWLGLPEARIAHRILWLEGLEEGLNRGTGLDSFRRFIYVHGLGDESALGRPDSCGCIHLAAKDLLPLFNRVQPKTLVWISLASAPRWHTPFVRLTPAGAAS